MFRKKRRMELAKPGERRRREEREPIDTAMTRRVFIARGAVGVAFAALGGKLWKMQIAEGDEFQRDAELNINTFQRLKSSRGRILDRSGKPLAENRRVWTVQIVPNRLPDDVGQRQAVLDRVARDLGLKQVVVLDRSLVPIGSEAAVANAAATALGLTDPTPLVAGLTRPGAVMQLLKEDLSVPDADFLIKERLSGITGVRSLTSLDYAIATHPTPDLPLTVKQDVQPDVAMAIAANVLTLPGVVVDNATLKRRYFDSEYFAHIIGYVGPINADEYEAEKTPGGTYIYDPDDTIGQGGVEQAFEKELRGSKGGRWIQIDSAGVERGELLNKRLDPKSGLSARLTIDLEFQKLVTEAVKKGLENSKRGAVEKKRDAPPGSGAAMVVNPKNGELLAMVSWPSFDNQAFVDGITQAAYDALLADKGKPLMNHCISGLYPPGSTLKPLLAVAGLQEDLIKPEDKVLCKGNIRVPHTWDETQGNTYPCWEYEIGHGELDMRSGIAHSCDVYFYTLGAPDQTAENGTRVHYYDPGDTTQKFFHGLGIERIEDYLKDVYGFGRPTGIELAGEADGLVPSPKWLLQSELNENWSIGDTINVSIGQGHLLGTPLQMLMGTAVIANGGKRYQPRLIKELVDDEGKVVKRFEPKMVRDMTQEPDDDETKWLKSEHIRVVHEGMLRAVTEGTGKGKITIQNVTVAAKSGTAEFGEIDPENGRYLSGHAWFSAYAPAEDPEICVVALVVGGYEGSTYAGPIVDDILKAYFETPGIRDASRVEAPEPE